MKQSKKFNGIVIDIQMRLFNCDHYIIVSNSYLDCFWTLYQIFHENFLSIFCRQCNLYNNIDGLAPERRNFSALAMELRLSCINPFDPSCLMLHEYCCNGQPSEVSPTWKKNQKRRKSKEQKNQGLPADWDDIRDPAAPWRPPRDLCWPQYAGVSGVACFLHWGLLRLDVRAQ